MKKLSKFAERITGRSGIGQLMEDLGSAIGDSTRMLMLGGGAPAHIPAGEKYFRKSMESELQHVEFLADGKSDPRIPFIENLLRDTEGVGDIIVYNQSFEMNRLREIAEDFPKYQKQITERLERIKDLMLPFQRKYYYKPEMKGSYSIKKVLPALVPELSYDGLTIAEGGAAMNAFEAMIYETDPKAIEKTRKNLLEYCKMDTLSMVKIYDFLQSIK